MDFGLIVDSGNHYVAQIKRNQPKLFDQVQEVIAKQQPLDYHFDQVRRNMNILVLENSLL